MLKFNLKKYAVVTVVAMTVAQSGVFSADEHIKAPTENTDKPKTEFTPAVRQENSFSKYDTLRERLEHLSKIAPKEKKNPELLKIEGQPDVVRITPAQAQFAEGAEILKRVKWYRERMAESCEQSDNSSKMLGQFIDECLINGLVFDTVKVDQEQTNKDQTTFELDAQKIHACKTELNAYYAAKKSKVGESEWKKFAIDQEINDKLTKFFNWYGASAEGISSGSKEQAASEPSDLIKEVGNISTKNLCLIEEVKAVSTPLQKPKYEPKKEEPKKQAVNQGPGEPSKQFTPPQVQNPAPQAPQPQPPVYQPPQQQPYQGGKYDPSGLGNGGKYDPRDRRRYDYDNFRDYGDKDYGSAPMYIPQMNPKGNYIPPSNNSLPPRQALPPPAAVGGPAPIAAAPFLGRGFSLGLGFSNAYGYPYGMMPYGPLYGGYGGGFYPGYGGGFGYGGGVPIVPISSSTPITSTCGGLISGTCGSSIGLCGTSPVMGGMMTSPINSCVNNMLYNPINQIPGRGTLIRFPGNPNMYNPIFNYGGFDPNRIWLPRLPETNPGNPLQTIPPINGPFAPPVTTPSPTIPTPVGPIYNPGTNPVPNTPIRITLPRTP